ncbi:hypothetical protein SK128_005547, partial [Halocaridina rubra]
METVIWAGMVERDDDKEKNMDDVTRVAGGHLKPAELLQLTRGKVRWRSMVADVE